MNIVNFYNPCLQISIGDLEEVMEQIGTPVIWVGDLKYSQAPLGQQNER